MSRELEFGEDTLRRVAQRVRAMHLQEVPATEFRGPYTRCSFCSWTWEVNEEKHAGACPLAPFGLAPGHEYKPSKGEQTEEEATDGNES